MRKLVTTLALSLAAVLAAQPAWAACAQLDLKGTWQAYSATVNDTYWMRCLIVIDETGAVAANKACKDSDGHSFKTSAGGKLTVTNACVVTGTVKIAGVTSTIQHAAMDKGKTVVTGVGSDTDFGKFIFNALKR